MTAKQRAQTPRRPHFPRPFNGHAREIPLRDHTEQALSRYFDSLNGHRFLRMSFAGSTGEMEEAVRRLAAWRR